MKNFRVLLHASRAHVCFLHNNNILHNNNELLPPCPGLMSVSCIGVSANGANTCKFPFPLAASSQGYPQQPSLQQQPLMPQQERLQGPSAGTYDRMADEIERMQLGEQEFARWAWMGSGVIPKFSRAVFSTLHIRCRALCVLHLCLRHPCLTSCFMNKFPTSLYYTLFPSLPPALPPLICCDTIM